MCSMTFDAHALQFTAENTKTEGCSNGLWIRTGGWPEPAKENQIDAAGPGVLLVPRSNPGHAFSVHNDSITTHVAGLFLKLSEFGRTCSCKNFVHDVSMNVGQSAVDSILAVDQSFMVDP